MSKDLIEEINEAWVSDHEICALLMRCKDRIKQLERELEERPSWTDVGELTEKVAALKANHKMNFEFVDNGIRICRGLHEKHEECEWEYFYPVARAQEPIGAMPAYGVIPWEILIAAVGEATGAPWQEDKSYYVGHQMVGINMNSLNRIVSKFATPPPSAEDAIWKGVLVQDTDFCRIDEKNFPTVLLSFNEDDWAARDAFVAWIATRGEAK